MVYTPDNKPRDLKFDLSQLQGSVAIDSKKKRVFGGLLKTLKYNDGVYNREIIFLSSLMIICVTLVKYLFLTPSMLFNTAVLLSILLTSALLFISDTVAKKYDACLDVPMAIGDSVESKQLYKLLESALRTQAYFVLIFSLMAAIMVITFACEAVLAEWLSDEQKWYGGLAVLGGVLLFTGVKKARKRNAEVNRLTRKSLLNLQSR